MIAPSPTSSATGPLAGKELLTAAEWESLADAHRSRVRRWTEPFRSRRARGQVHPVYDFLFLYYPFSPGRLEEWHPNPDQAAEESAATIVSESGDEDVIDPNARFRTEAYARCDGFFVRSSERIRDKERARLEFTRALLKATESRRPHFGCFGMHEWAMVYRGDAVRHGNVAPLRLPQAAIDAHVESRPFACSHFDAFRFFADEARPLNKLQPSLETRIDLEQPGCVHATMDLYKWAYKSMPWVGSDLVWRAFVLALDAREIDMRASPYDMARWNLPPIRIETAEGRRSFSRYQSQFMDRAAALRTRLIDEYQRLLAILAAHPSERPE